MHIKRMHEMVECLTEYGKCMVEAGVGNGKVNLCDIGQVVDMIKDLSEAEKDALIAKEMKKCEEEEQKSDEYILLMFKEQYGEDDGKRYYDEWRYKSGQFAPKGRGTRRGYEEPPYYHMMPEDYKEHDAEYWRDMDRKSKGVMYYTEPMMNDNKESRYDKAKRGYTETKELHKGDTQEDNRENMRGLEELLGVIGGDLKEVFPKMSPSEKAMTAQKLDAWSKMLKQ